MKWPDVSLVVTCYNHGRFLAEALTSALGQTRAFEEIIVVDDGSTDDTAAVAAGFPQVKYLRQDRRGLGAARNSGMRQSSCEFLVFLDADDRLHPNAVEAGLRCLQADPTAKFVYGAYRYLRHPGESRLQRRSRTAATDAYLALLRDNCVAMHATVMYRREALLAVRGFDEELAACEDYDLYLRIARDGGIVCHGEVVADYRHHGGNMSRDARLMLFTSVGVLKAQWPRVRGDRVRERAYRQGMRNWQVLYGTKWAGQIAATPPDGGIAGRAGRRSCSFVARAPHALAANRHRVYGAVARRALHGAAISPGGTPDRRAPQLRRFAGTSRWATCAGSSPSAASTASTAARRSIGTTSSASSPRGPATSAAACSRSATTRTRAASAADASAASDVLNVDPAGGSTTIVSDLAAATIFPTTPSTA